ncbi:MAG: hypothetical protein HY606_04510 [Planctomycetes bacterium]|nr:hypothetical protein [Planctomycetota bacterium]
MVNITLQIAVYSLLICPKTSSADPQEIFRRSAKDKVKWIDNLEKGLKAIKESGKPALLYFEPVSSPPEHINEAETFSAPFNKEILDDKDVAEFLNANFICVNLLLYKKDENSPSSHLIYTNKYEINTEKVMQLSFVASDGEEVKSLKYNSILAGKVITKDDFMDKLKDLKKLNKKIDWRDNLEDAIKRGKEGVNPVIYIAYWKNDESAKKLLGLLNEKQYLLGRMKDEFIWCRYEDDSSDIRTKSSIRVVDPFKDDKLTVKFTEDLDLLKTAMEKHFDRFEKNYLAENKYLCNKCNKIKSASGKCCEKELKKIRTFRCEKCGTPSSKQKKCCGQDNKPVTQKS